MDLSLDRPDDYLFVRRTSADAITLADRELKRSFLLTPDQVVENWAADSAERLSADHVEALLALQPELVLLGTGQRQVFPAPAFTAGFLRKGVGIEVMDNAAAARTYNLLAGEGRRVLAAFILGAAGVS
ncbi:Mth938-like domain-containing protein [Rhodanobacter caeni]|uniref:Mth938-like domain-containing protein n=1 Tax=Rhodanobacter caeni TaxID=657654 RepID=UPI0031D12826